VDGSHGDEPGVFVAATRTSPRRAAKTTKPTFVLLHSPLVGPSTWRWVAEVLHHQGHKVIVPSMLGFANKGPPYWPRCVAAVVRACRRRTGPFVLVGHSGAGPLLPGISEALGARATHLVFAEASVPPLSGFAETVPSWLRDNLLGLASGGTVPMWSKWWGETAMEALVPDPERRRCIEDELPELPLDYFDHAVPVPEGWAEHVRCSYLWFSDIYRSDAEEAARRGWPVRGLPGGSHLLMVMQPETVAQVLIQVIAEGG
jgi:pimeloyl-ACP methyl ester carboxylesterase